MTNSIPNYVCSACGRGFSRKYSANRHLSNVEKGIGYIVSEGDYRVSLSTGTVAPPMSTATRVMSATIASAIKASSSSSSALLPSAHRKEKIEDMSDIAFRNFYAGLYWQLGADYAASLNQTERDLALSMIKQKTISFFNQVEDAHRKQDNCAANFAKICEVLKFLRL